MNVAERKSHDTLQEIIDAFDREDPTFDVLEWMGRARQAIALLTTSPPYTVIDLGYGKWEVAAGTSAKIPCIAIGTNDTGRVGEIVTAEPRQMSVEETFAVITFANIDGLEVLQEKLNEVRKDHFADAPAPVWVQQSAVPQGWTFGVSDDDDGTWLRVKSPDGREAAFSAVNGGLAHDNRRSIASRVLLELKEALAATPAPAPAPSLIAPNAVWLIHYDDADRRPEILTSEQAARAYFKRISGQWNAHLFVKVESNSRDDRFYSLNASMAPAPAQEVATLTLAAEDVHAAFAKNFPKTRISQAWINFAADIAQAIAARAAKPAQDVGLTDGEPAHGAGLLEQRRELDAIEFFESTNRDSYGFKKSVRGIYVNPAVARDWKWFQLGMKHATEDES